VAVSSQDNGFEKLWTCTQRTIDGNVRHYIEQLAEEVSFKERFDFFTNDEADDNRRFRNFMFENQKEYIHVDSSLTFDGSARGSAASSSVTPAAVSGLGITFTASAPVFTSDDVGNQIWKKSVTGEEEGRAEITAFTSSTSVDCTITKNFDTTDVMAAGNWYLTAQTISGLDHLEGEDVSIIADGGQHPLETVTDGELTLDYQVSVAHIGLKYIGFLKTMNLERATSTGVSQTKPKNMYQLGIKFLDTLGAKYGTSLYRFETVLSRSPGDFTDRPPLLFSGDKILNYSDNWGIEKFVFIKQDNSLPCVVQALIPYISIQEPFTGA